jgi:hypothetical protein
VLGGGISNLGFVKVRISDTSAQVAATVTTWSKIALKNPSAVWVPAGPQLCISRRAATGTCFGGVSELQIAALTIGECVAVTFDPHTELLGERDVNIRRIRRMSGAGAGFVHSLWISARSGSCELPHRGARALADRDG